MANKKHLPNVTIEGARVIYRNFTGRGSQFNQQGSRNFCVLIEEPTAMAMRDDGWNVKTRPARDEGGQDEYYIQVAVNYASARPPQVVMINSRGRTNVDEDLCDMLDYADFSSVDMIINPYAWEIKNSQGTTEGVKGYLTSLFVTINENELELKYADIPEAAPRHLDDEEAASF